MRMKLCDMTKVHIIHTINIGQRISFQQPSSPTALLHNCRQCGGWQSSAPNPTSLQIQLLELPNSRANQSNKFANPIAGAAQSRGQSNKFANPIARGSAGGRGAEGLARHRRGRIGALCVFVFCFWGPHVVGVQPCECWRNRVFSSLF